jgi:tripartite-type tricarboxylate transporter receptor subunit TctC
MGGCAPPNLPTADAAPAAGHVIEPPPRRRSVTPMRDRRCASTYRIGLGVLLALATFQPQAGIAAETFPVKAVRMIAPFSAGGGADTVARLIAQKLSELLGQQVIVDNRPGASNIIGTEVTARAVPDGYTIMIANSVHAINAGLFRKLPYDPINDFAPISLVVSTPYVLIVHPSLPVKSVRELVALAKAKPGQVNYASPGRGTAAHLAAEMFRLGAGVNIVHIPYKGITGALVDTMAGTTQILIASPLTVLPQVKAGKLHALAVTTAARSKSLPDLPTMRESGIPGYEFSSWYGLLAPRAVPAAIVAMLSQAAAKAVQQKDVQARLENEAAEAVGNTPGQFGDYLKLQIDKYQKLVKDINLPVE